MPLLDNNRVVIIVGPTAVGKTDLSIKLAKKMNGEIISADSRYLYRGMDIGTAKPSKVELETVRHYLIDVADIDENWSLAVYQSQALAYIKKILSEKKLPFLVGGTGQYIFSILEGWQIPTIKPDYCLRDVLQKLGEEIGKEALFEKLEIIDPQAAALMDSGNTRRTIRALEVIFTTGHLFSVQRQKKPVGFSYKLIGLTRDRKNLYERIDARIEGMMELGFVHEVEDLLQKGFVLDLPPMSAIGYKEIGLYLNGQLEMSECIALIKRRSRQFVRRQANWFNKKDERITWFDLDLDVDSEKSIEDFISSERGWINE